MSHHLYDDSPDLEEAPIDPFRLGVAIALACAILFGFALWAKSAEAANVGQIPQDVLDDQRSMDWFKQPGIQACCSTADGYVTEYEFSQQTNHYRIPSRENPDTWIDVPDEAVRTDAGNPTGYAWVWWYAYQNPDGSTSIRCFVPNGGA